jgi:hypothetical protein
MRRQKTEGQAQHGQGQTISFQQINSFVIDINTIKSDHFTSCSPPVINRHTMSVPTAPAIAALEERKGFTKSPDKQCHNAASETQKNK